MVRDTEQNGNSNSDSSASQLQFCARKEDIRRNSREAFYVS